MFKFFSGTVQKEVMKIIANRIKNAEIAFKAECKTLAEQKRTQKIHALNEYCQKTAQIDTDHETRKTEILTKRVNGIVSKVL